MTTDEKDKLLPGSKEAIKKGCLCPTKKNLNGKGVPCFYPCNGFYINQKCSIHGNWIIRLEKILGRKLVLNTNILRN